jgi:hypothetical protein
MGAVIGQLLPYALGIAISPIPIVAVILMLFSRRASTNGWAYLAGWVLGMLAVIVVVRSLANLAGATPGSPPAWTAWLRLLLGVLLLVLGVRRWLSRPPTGVTGPLPPWLQAVDELQPGPAAAMGALLSGINPKNLALTAAAALVLVGSNLDGLETFVAMVVFVALASASIAAPLLYWTFGGPPARAVLDTWRAWLQENNATVMAVLLVVFGVVLVGQGLAAA